MKKELLVSSKIIGIHLVIALVIFFIFEILFKYPFLPIFDTSIFSIIIAFHSALYIGYSYKKRKKFFTLKDIALIGLISSGIYLGIYVVIGLILSIIHIGFIMNDGYRLFDMDIIILITNIVFIILSGLVICFALWLFNKRIDKK